MKSKGWQQKRFMKIISLPIRGLSKARDLYVKSMTEYGERMNSCNVVAIPVSLPRSFNGRSYNRDEDFRELVRASSSRSFGDIKHPPRSSSVAMGRIDEDRPCCYLDQDNSSSVTAKNEIKKP